MTEFPLKLTALAQHIVSSHIRSGDVVIDATVGNGEDTLHLARCVGEEGFVLGFDIQETCLEKTIALLTENNLHQRVKLVCSGHEKMLDYVTDSPRVVMFNLGYLPGGSSAIHTKTETTLLALEKSIEVLDDGGLITLCLYSHREGLKEKEAIFKWVEGLPKYFQVLRLSPLKRNNPPELLVIKNTKTTGS
ncbi:MAG: class I SAM-dependent methyltransferase [Eubacteriaceae bacterium]|jgi:uncharacterized SAM-dependent methyltransferase|nr:class I SAM-dependent methyltransferase [Eubacteriaceae bacterium]